MGPVTFLHPALLAGLAAAAGVPTLLHLRGGRRAPRVAFAAMMLVAAAGAARASRRRLHDLLLWAVRTALLAGLVVALARPVPQGSAAAAAAADAAPRRLALVLDTSASMAYRHGGASLAAAARRRAHRLVGELISGDVATVLVAGPQVRALLPAPTPDLAAVDAAIDRADGGGGSADLGAALAQAAAQLGAVAGARAEIVVIGDLAAQSLATLMPLPTPAPEVVLLDAAERAPLAPLANVALTHLTVTAAPEDPNGRRLTVAARNFGAGAVRGRGVLLAVAGAPVQRAHLSLAAGGTGELVLQHVFPGPGTYAVEVRLAADAADGLAADDVLAQSVEVGAPVRVLAIDGAPRAVPYDDELFFVERALAAVPPGDPAFVWSVHEAEALAGPELDLGGVDVVLLANVAQLAPAASARLGAFVAGGGGLLVGLGDQIEPEAVNQSYGALLPQPLRDAHLAADPALGTQAVAIDEVAWDHPLVANLGPQLVAGLAASRTSRYVFVDAAPRPEPVPASGPAGTLGGAPAAGAAAAPVSGPVAAGGAPTARVVLRFADGAPALVAGSAAGSGGGGGQVALWTSSLDVDGTDLPLRPAFVPLLQRTLRHLAGAGEGPPSAPVRAGASVRLRLPAAATAMALELADGTRLEAAADAGGEAALGPLVRPGRYRAALRRRGAWAAAPRLDQEVWPSLAESDYAPADPQAVARALTAPGAAPVEVGTATAPDVAAGLPPATLCLALAALLATAEGLLAARARSAG